MKHWTQGGTALTNFAFNRMPVFFEAVKRYGSVEYQVALQSFPPCPSNYGGSLHYFGTGDCSPFWKFFEEVDAELNNTEKYQEAGRVANELINNLNRKK
jgi:hypothetical protein